MEKELLNSDKELLLKDLCARLPYGVKVNYNEEICTIDSIGSDSELLLKNNDGEIVPKWEDSLFISIEKCKPYLFPLSSMTGAHRAELFNLRIPIEHPFQDTLCEIDFYHRYHFDYRGLIEKGLAIDCTALNVY